MPQTEKVLVAMSGGVDSSVTAALLKDAGYDVAGIYMYMNQTPLDNPSDEDINRSQHASDAQRIADILGIELMIKNYQTELREIVDYFIDEYRHARTPNPCVLCNRKLKFGKLLDQARQDGFDYLATGHYARVLVEDGISKLTRAKNIAKDQAYALFAMGYRNLQQIKLPLGEYEKSQVREMAKKMNLPVHDKDDSQEICFVPNDDYAALISKLAPDLCRPGKVVDTSGKVLGDHEGIFKYTIGQRRGLGIAMGEPVYVTQLDAETNTVVLGSREDLMKPKLLAGNICWITPDAQTEPFDAIIQIRYNHRGAPGRVTPVQDENGNPYQAIAEFDESVSAITPGQAAVFFTPDNKHVIGGGWIERAM